MMRISQVAAISLGALFVTTAAQAQHYCGHDKEPAQTHTVVVPTGQSIIGYSVPQSGLGDNGIAVQNNQKYCGETAAYLYTGSNPTSDIQVWLTLDPTIVSPTVAQVKCNATLAVTAPAYYVGYPDAEWPMGFRVDQNDQQVWDGSMHVMLEAIGWGPLNPWTTYTIVANCSPNL